MSTQPPGESLLRKFRWRAIVFGIVTDFVASEIFNVAITVAAGAAFAANGAKPEEFDALFIHSPRILGAALVGGLFFTGMGGYVAGGLAPRAPYWNALAVGVFDVLYDLTSIGGGEFRWLNVIGIAAALPCALFGAFVAAHFTEREASPPSASAD
jgi:hypothetical protein